MVYVVCSLSAVCLQFAFAAHGNLDSLCTLFLLNSLFTSSMAWFQMRLLDVTVSTLQELGATL